MELAAVGIHCNFAPVLDLHTNPDNPVIGNRALGSDPTPVTTLARSILLSFRRNGIAGCGKHFPGHGDTALDSHATLPTVSLPRERLLAFEMAIVDPPVEQTIPELCYEGEFDLSRFFSDPPERDVAPDFDEDVRPVPGTFPDPEVHGIAPGVTQVDWSG